jgi:hypothetical protein
MPFDGTYFARPTVRDTGLFPIWSTWGCRLWVETRFCRGKSGNTDGIMRVWLTPADHDAAIIQLLQDAKGLIADAKTWTRGTYGTLRARRCAVGALRAAARRLDGPTPAWAAHELLIDIARSRGFSSVEAMNDRSSHAAVLAAFDQAIATAQRAAPARSAANAPD